MTDKAMSEKEAAEYLGLRPNTLSNWRITRKGPPYYRVGGRIIYRLKELEFWLQRHKQLPENEAS